MGTRRRHRKLRGGLTRDEETAFLKKKQESDRQEALHIGEKALHEKSPAVEGVGTGTRAFDPHESGHANTEQTSARARAESRGGRRTRKRKHRKTRHRR